MTREQIIEVMARAVCVEHGADPDGRSREQRHAVKIDGVSTIISDHMGPLWKLYANDASAALTALEQAGYVVVPCMNDEIRTRLWQILYNGSDAASPTNHTGG